MTQDGRTLKTLEVGDGGFFPADGLPVAYLDEAVFGSFYLVFLGGGMACVGHGEGRSRASERAR